MVAESAARWQNILDRVPDLKELYSVASSRLAAAGHYDAAELALEKAVSLEPAAPAVPLTPVPPAE